MSDFNDEKAHYQSLISLHKYTITLATSIITIIGIGVGLITYSNGQEMREDIQLQKEENNRKLDRLTTEIDKYKDKIDKLSEKVNRDVDRTRTDAINEIGNIKVTSSFLAQQEARKKINEVFEYKNFDDFVNKIAQERIEPKINKLVDNKIIQNEELQIENALKNLASSEYLQFNKGVAFLNFNQNIQLTENQIKTIINIFKRSTTSEDNQYQIAGILHTKKSENCTLFFKELIFTEEYNHTLTQYSIKYFLVNNLEHAFFSKYVDYIINQSNNHPTNTFINILSTASQISVSHTRYLINDKNLVNQLFNQKERQYFDGMKLSVETLVKPIMAPDIYKNTYLFLIH
jgi:hypothetical protein